MIIVFSIKKGKTDLCFQFLLNIREIHKHKILAENRISLYTERQNFLRVDNPGDTANNSTFDLYYYK